MPPGGPSVNVTVRWRAAGPAPGVPLTARAPPACSAALAAPACGPREVTCLGFWRYPLVPVRHPGPGWAPAAKLGHNHGAACGGARVVYAGAVHSTLVGGRGLGALAYPKDGASGKGITGRSAARHDADLTMPCQRTHVSEYREPLAYSKVSNATWLLILPLLPATCS